MGSDHSWGSPGSGTFWMSANCVKRNDIILFQVRKPSDWNWFFGIGPGGQLMWFDAIRVVFWKSKLAFSAKKSTSITLLLHIEILLHFQALWTQTFWTMTYSDKVPFSWKIDYTSRWKIQLGKKGHDQQYKSGKMAFNRKFLALKKRGKPILLITNWFLKLY